MRPNLPARPRLSDVAERAGVSKKTVSNVINDFPFVTDHTRTKVLDAIQELGYRPNLSARNLARGRTGIIALVIPRLDMPYFSELARHVVDIAQHRSEAVLIEQTADNDGAEQRILDGELSRRIDGMLYSPRATSSADLHRRADNTPMVLLGEVIKDASFDQVSIDNEASGRAATEHLIGIGRRRIAAIGLPGPDHPGAARQRQVGYEQAMATAGLELDPALEQATKHFDGESGEAAMNALLDLEHPPDAVFCFADLVALGAIQAIHRRGLRIPEDVAVVGHDDLPFGRFASPSLTTISPDKRAIAETALDLLARRIAGRPAPDPQGVLVPFELKVRDSTRA